MKVIYLDKNNSQLNESLCSAIGFFDGLHLGHMALVNEVLEVSRKKKLKSALMTFDHYPLYVLGKIKEEKYLTTMKDRIQILESLGFDYLLVIHFTKEIASLKPQDFISQFIIHNHIEHLVCGFDFRFGHFNQGNVETLKACKQIDISVIDKVIYKGEKISSTRIRQCLDLGDIQELKDLLGRHYTIQGEVIEGRQIGRSIGFPTANIDFQSYYLPVNGVYIVKIYVGNQWYMGMCNIGYNPTFEALKKKSLEVYILDFDKNIYHQNVIVEFYDMIRHEKPFENKEGLIQQLTYDKNKVREYFESQNH